MYHSTIKEFFCVGLLLCMINYGQTQSFSAQPPSDVVAMADQPVTQLECRAQCLLPRNVNNCIIKWFRWTDAGDAKPISDSCHSLPYSEWTHRKAFLPFRVLVHSKLIINKFTPAYSGRYFCSMKDLGKLIRSNNVTLKAANATADNPIVNPVQNCCLPSIQSINALLLPKEDNGNMCANVTWNEVPGDCEILQWRLALLEWDGIPSYDFADDGNQTNYYEVVSRSWVIVCGLTTTKYYQFQLSTTVQTYNTSLKFGSHTHFFGNSKLMETLAKSQLDQTFRQPMAAYLSQFTEEGSCPARIVHIEPQYKEILEGDKFEITCAATGMPPPDVQMVKVVSSIPDRSGIGTVPLSENTPVVTRRKVIKDAKLSHSGHYLCIASNTLVNPPQGTHKTTSTAIITVKVVKRTKRSSISFN